MDNKTLKLASIQLTEPLLAQFLTYQHALVRELDKTVGHDDWSGRFAFAHSHALTEAGLDTVTYGKLKALVGDFCSRESSVRQLRDRLAVARAAPSGSEKESRVVARAEAELPALEADQSLVQRYGAAAVELLSAHGDEVLRLHREVAHREGCTRI
jgi:hypothetical protein